MRTFEEIRKLNRRKDMLLTGMEEKTILLHPDAVKEIKNFYRDFIKPARVRVFLRQIEKGNL